MILIICVCNLRNLFIVKVYIDWIYYDSYQDEQNKEELNIGKSFIRFAKHEFTILQVESLTKRSSFKPATTVRDIHQEEEIYNKGLELFRNKKKAIEKLTKAARSKICLYLFNIFSRKRIKYLSKNNINELNL